MTWRDAPGSRDGWGTRTPVSTDAHHIGRFLNCLLSLTHWEWK